MSTLKLVETKPKQTLYSTLIAFYKSRYTKLMVRLTNPSKAHLKRLEMSGHDLKLYYYDANNKLLKYVFLKY